MGYDMSIIDPDPSAVEETKRISALLYGADGAYQRRNNWPKAGVPERIPGTDVTDLHAHYVQGTGEPAFWALLDQIKALDTELAPIEAQTYFRLNIWGMGIAREEMLVNEMVYRPTAMPEWPDIPNGYYEAVDESWTDDLDRPTAACPPEFRDYVQAKFDVLSHCEERPGINIEKLGSNDGWIVTAIECAGALHQWKVNAEDPEAIPHNGDRLITWWPEWLAFLLHASTHGGFRVW